MRRIVQISYLSLLRLSGALAALFALVFFVNLPNALADGQFVTSPAIFLTGVFFASVTLIFPSLTPAWLADPHKALHLFINVVVLTVLGLAFVLTPMMTIVPMRLEEPLSQNLSVYSGAFLGILVKLAWWLALALAVWPRPEKQNATVA